MNAKHFLSFIALITISIAGLCQKPQSPPNTNNDVFGKPTKKPTYNASVLPSVIDDPLYFEASQKWIEVFEFPNFQGRSVKITSNKSGYGEQLFSFKPDKISIKRGNCKTWDIYFNQGMQGIIANDMRFSHFKVSGDITELRVGNEDSYNIIFVERPWVQIFEQPNYQGKSEIIALGNSRPLLKEFRGTLSYHGWEFVNDEVQQPNLGLSFSTSGGSIKLGSDNFIATLMHNHRGRIIYTLIDRNSPNIIVKDGENVIANAGDLAGITINIKGAMRLGLQNVLATIHNNDCRRMYGRVKVRLVHKDMNGLVKAITGGIKRGISDREGWVELYNSPKESSGSPSPLVRNKSDAALPPQTYNYEDGKHQVLFYDDGAFRTGRLFLQIKFNICTHHKGCDLCTDYTDQTCTGEKIDEIQFYDYRNYHANGHIGNLKTIDHTHIRINDVFHNTNLVFSYQGNFGYEGYRQAFPY